MGENCVCAEMFYHCEFRLLCQVTAFGIVVAKKTLLNMAFNQFFLYVPSDQFTALMSGGKVRSVTEATGSLTATPPLVLHTVEISLEYSHDIQK